MQSACRGTPRSRSLGLLWLLGVLPVLLSCSAAPPAPHTPTKAAPKPRWDGFDRARAWPSVDGPRASRGHGVDASLVEVRISPEALAAYRALVPGSALPVGTTAVAFHRTPDGVPGSVYAMIKLRDGQWDFVVTESDGVLVARGALPLCASCHDAARADHLFGLPALPRN